MRANGATKASQSLHAGCDGKTYAKGRRGSDALSGGSAASGGGAASGGDASID
jgi:hypothetical protein